MASQLTAEDVDGLLAASRSPASWPHVMQHRAALMETVVACLSELEASPGGDGAATCHLLLQALRVVRNLCAGGPAACEELLGLGAVAAVSKVLDLVERAAIQLDWQLPLVGSQLLANAATAGPACAAAVWGAAFPTQLNALAHVNSGPTQAALALCLLSCCRQAPGAAAALCGAAGAPVMAAALRGQQRLHKEGLSNDNLGLLLSYLCFHLDLLPELAASLAGPAASGSSNGAEAPNLPHAAAVETEAGTAVAAAAAAVAAHPSMANVVLLQELSHEAQAEGHLSVQQDSGAGPTATRSMQFLVALVNELAQAASRGPLSEGQQQVMQDALQVMRDIAGAEEPAAETGFQQHPTLVGALQQAGFVPLLLAALKALGPIRSPQHPGAQQQADGGPGGSSGEGLAVVELAPCLAQRAEQLPAQPPYLGYRTDLLSVLANASYRRPAVKAEVQSLGGVELVLSQCQMDRASPLAREWALWAVRNLCEGNEAAQTAIRELQLCTAVETEEVQQLGVKLELDKDTGKLRVVQQPQRPGQAPSEQEQQQEQQQGQH